VPDDFDDLVVEDPTINTHALSPDLNLLSPLNREQQVRVAALNVAKPMLNKGLLGTPPELSELIRLTSWILDGNEEPLYPFVSGGVIVLGPDLHVSIDGDSITWKDTTYLKEESHED